jgi:tetratricopeptide (TPR) repeat protein
MQSVVFLLVITACWCAVSLGGSHTGAHDTAPAVVAARRARDHADIATLQRLIEEARTRASHTRSFDAAANAALCADWLGEAAYAQQHARLVEQSAAAGMRAAEHAVQLNPGSARAHWLLGALAGKLMPHSVAGGLRYGRRAIRELETAMQLDAANANASLSRAIAYFLTPAVCGGNTQKAIALLQKAASLDPAPDGAETAHIWLALASEAVGQKHDAVREMHAARRLNPERRFVAHVSACITSDQGGAS